MKLTNSQKRKLRDINKKINSKRYYQKSTYNVNIDFENKGISDFETKKEFNNYVKEANSILKKKDFLEVDLDSLDYKISKQEYNKFTRLSNTYRQRADAELSVIYDEYFPDKPSMLVDFANQRKYPHLKYPTYSPQDFESKQEFDKMLGVLEKANKPNYFQEKNELLQDNFKRAFREVYSEYGKEYEEFVSDDLLANSIYNYIDNMDNKEFMRVYYENENFFIGYLYSYKEAEEKLEYIASILDIE